MVKKIMALSLVLVMVLSFTACAEESESGVELPSAQEINEGMLKSWGDVRTYQFDTDMTIDTYGEVNGKMIESTGTLTMSDVLVDLENKKMRAASTVSVAVPGEPKTKMDMDIYLIGDMMYALGGISEMPPMWIKSEMPEGYFEQMNQVGNLMERLELWNTEVIGGDKVKGIECYVIQQTLEDVEQLWQLAMQQPLLPGEEPLTEEVFKEMLRNYSVKSWIKKDTYLLNKSEINMVWEMPPSAMGYLSEEGVITMDVAVNILVYNYNQPVSIMLPPEAEEAIELPIQ